jgi:uncharacterized protein (UPF0276 family)
MVEWDDDIPSWPRLVQEIDCARAIHERASSAPERLDVAVAG